MIRKMQDRAARIAFLLMQGPKSLGEIATDLKIDVRHTERVRPFIDAFRSQGLVYVASVNRHGWPIYAWQPAPFALPDAVQLTRRRERKPKPEIRMVNSIFSMGV